MNKIFSNLVEYVGIEFFKAINRKRAMDEIFRDVSEVDEESVQAIYSNVEIFNKSDSFTVPKVIDTNFKKNLQIQTLTMPSSYQPIKELHSLYESFQKISKFFLNVLVIVILKYLPRIALSIFTVFQREAMKMK